MALGLLFGIAATLLWGFVYVVPLLLPASDPASIALFRYVLFGAACAVAAYVERGRIARLTPRDWRRAALLGVVGNLVFYGLVASSVRLAGAPTAGAFSALVPVTVAVAANAIERRRGGSAALPWKRLLAPLCLTVLGMVILNAAEWAALVRSGVTTSGDFALGFLCGFLSLVVWTWYPIANAAWLAEHPDMPPSAGVTVQGLALLPVALPGFAVWSLTQSGSLWGAMGPEPLRFLAWTAVLAFLCSWAAIWCWNSMSRRLPPALGGQLIVFETVFAVLYAHVLRGVGPDGGTALGVAVLLLGVIGALRAFRGVGGVTEERKTA